MDYDCLIFIAGVVCGATLILIGIRRGIGIYRDQHELGPVRKDKPIEQDITGLI